MTSIKRAGAMTPERRKRLIGHGLMCGECLVMMRRLSINYNYTEKGKQKTRAKGIGQLCTLCGNVAFDMDLEDKDFYRELQRRDLAKSPK